MLRLAQERELLTVINDQYGAPTGADLIADVTAHAIRRVQNTQNISLGGVYHLVASGETTWHGYANHVIDQAKRISPALAWTVTEVAPVPTRAFPTPAVRPLNSRLCTTKLQQAFDLVMPPWQQGVDRMLAEIPRVHIILLMRRLHHNTYFWRIYYSSCAHLTDKSYIYYKCAKYDFTCLLLKI